MVNQVNQRYYFPYYVNSFFVTLYFSVRTFIFYRCTVCLQKKQELIQLLFF